MYELIKFKGGSSQLKRMIVLFGVLLFASTALAVELNVDFIVPDGTLRTLGVNPDATLTTMPDGSGVVRVLKGNPQPPTALETEDTGNPIATYAGVTPISGTVGTDAGAGGFFFAHSRVNVTSGNRFFVRMWNSANSCYADTDTQSISWTDSPLPTYPLTYSSATAYWAMAPGAASLTVGESMRRNNNGTPLDPSDDFYELTLTVTPSYNESTTHIQLAETPDHSEFRIHCYKATEPEPALTVPDTDHRVAEINSGSATFSGGPGPYFTDGDYIIRVYTFNHFGDGGPATLAWSTLGGGGGMVTYTINLRRILGGHGVNSFSVPRAGSVIQTTGVGAVDGTVCSTAYDLVNAINRIQGGGSAVAFVRVFGYWDQVAQAPAGVTIDYAGATMDGVDEAALRGIALEAGEGYQLYIRPEVDADINMTFELR